MTTEPGAVFDQVAEQYEQVRPGYPLALVEQACATAGLEPGSPVLEVGCGPGKLTVELARRGLSIDAVDPGPRLVEIARRHVRGLDVRFHVSRFEDVVLPEGRFHALFSATAFHWVDPAVGWAKAARLLRAGGTLGLLAHVDGSSGELHDDIVAAWRDIVPEAPQWLPHDPETLREGVEARRENVSEVWSWVTHHDLGRPEAAELFDDVQATVVSEEHEETAAELLALVRTTSTFLRLDPPRRQRLEARIRTAIDDAGGIFRSTTCAVLVTARSVA